MKQNIYIIFGPPGSGKGTQAKKIADNFHLVYFGTGDLMRKEAESKSEIGLEFQNIWTQGQGKLIPEKLVDEFIKEKLNELNFDNGVIFDGFPRTVNQAKTLQEVFEGNNIKDYLVINLLVDYQELINRTATRRICQNCKTTFENPIKRGILSCNQCNGKLIQREEDKPEVVKNRLNVYRVETEPVISYYENKNKIVNVDGNPSIEKVYQNILNVINDQH